MRKYIQEWNFGLENCHADKKGKGEKPKRIEPLNQESIRTLEEKETYF